MCIYLVIFWQEYPKTGITLMESYYEDGIATLNVILGRGLDSYGKNPLTPNPTAYEGFPFISGFGDVWVCSRSMLGFFWHIYEYVLEAATDLQKWTDL